MNYFIHRISHESEVSYPLLDMGYLSIGWSVYADSGLMNLVKEGGETAFNDFMSKHQNRYRQRWFLWYFSQFKKDDYVVVPLYGKEVAVCRVEGDPQSILTLAGKEILLDNGLSIVVGSEGICYENGEKVDLGFIVRVSVIKKLLRSCADDFLTARMKMRGATGRIDDLRESVEALLQTDMPISVHKDVLPRTHDLFMDLFLRYVKPQDLEQITLWYLKKKGADEAWIPPKNESGKYEHADADVVAVFRGLDLTIYAQVKKHTSQTDEWAVEQISKYKDQRMAKTGMCTAWVISMAESFSQRAEELANEKNVRLVNGREFLEMLLDVGFGGIDE